MSTIFQNSYTEEMEREIINVAPAAVYELLWFKSYDVKKICIQAESECEEKQQ